MDCIKEYTTTLVHNNFSSSFSELLVKDKSVTIHHRKLQTLAYEIFKVKNNMAPYILTEIFPQKESNYSLRNCTALQGRSIKTVTYGSETISSLGPKIWDILPTELKKIVSPTYFVLSVEIFYTYKESVGAVIDSKPYTP